MPQWAVDHPVQALASFHRRPARSPSSGVPVDVIRMMASPWSPSRCRSVHAGPGGSQSQRQGAAVVRSPGASVELLMF